MAETMGLHTPSFRDKFKDLISSLKRSMLQYAKSLHDLAEHRVSEQIDPGIEPAGNIKMTEEGFPILPEPSYWRGRTKQEIERLIRTYVGQHYSEFLVRIMQCLTEISNKIWHPVAGKSMCRSER